MVESPTPSIEDQESAEEQFFAHQSVTEEEKAAMREPVAARRQPAAGEFLPEEGSAAAATLASRRRLQKVPWIISGFLLLTNILQPVFYAQERASRHEIALLDVNANLIASPLLQPLKSDQIQTICFNWASRGLLERNPTGFANPVLIESFFDKDAKEKAFADWQAQEEQAKQKEAFQYYAPFHYGAQQREGNRLRVRVDGQLDTVYRDNGRLLRDVRPLAIELVMHTNPDLGRNRFFPLIVSEWRYLTDPMPLPSN